MGAVAVIEVRRFEHGKDYELQKGFDCQVGGLSATI